MTQRRLLSTERSHSRGQHQGKFMGTKKKRLHKKTIKPPQDWFGTLTWLPFHCFGTSIWPPWRHVKTLYYRLCYRLRKKTLLNENFINGVRVSQVLITTKVRYIQWTICYFRAIKRSPINIPRKAFFLGFYFFLDSYKCCGSILSSV